MTLEDASPENRSIHLEITLQLGTVGTEWDVPGFSGTLNVIMASASLRPASHGVSGHQVGKLGRELALFSGTYRVFLSHFLSVPCCRFLLPRHPMTLIP